MNERRTTRQEERDQVGTGPSAAFFVAVDCPVSYVVAERVERDLGEIDWVPVLRTQTLPWAHERLRRARDVAGVRRLPVLEPENFPADPRLVTRAAVYASLQGAGPRFMMAAMRLAFAGRYDLSEPDVIAEAAAAADLDEDQVLQAAASDIHDDRLATTSRGLRSIGIVEAPALRICGGWFTGFDALAENSEFAAARASHRALPIEPVA